MKRLVLILMLCAFGAIVRAQVAEEYYRSMTAEGKTWKTDVIQHYYIEYEGRQMIIIDSVYTERTYCHRVEGDTIIGGKAWKKVYSNQLTTDYSYFAAIREEGERVYGVPGGEEKEYLLYDYGIKVGDKLRCTDRTNSFKYIFPVDSMYWGWQIKMTLLDIDTINVDGYDMRRFIFDADYAAKSKKNDIITTDHSSEEEYPTFKFPALVWIEGIGSDGGPFLSWYKNTQWGRLSCLMNEEEYFKSDYFYLPNDVAAGVVPRRKTPINSDVTYDLQGRRVTDTAKPGVYVRNGRKVVKR